MIASLKGLVYSKKPEGIIVDVRGIGYHVCVPICSLTNIPEPGEEIFLHTYTHVREDTLQLYGFLTEEEKKIFITLIGISGIGPKLGLAILSGISPEKFIEAVYNEDVSLLINIPGLGKKTASRLILELKGKLPASVSTAIPGKNPLADDAVSALINFGYKKSTSEMAVDKALKSGANSIEDIIKSTLGNLTDNK